MSKVDLKQFINQNKINISLIIFFIFSLYCALTIGETWDYEDNLSRGKITLDYLFSFGELDRNISFREYYSTIYWSLSYLITKQFPSQYQVEISHLINLIFSLSTIIGIGKVTGELFNKKIGKITFLILFFYPIFFGHMAINTKDTILAFSHVWITYLLLKYIKKQEFNRKRNSYIIYLSILAAIGSGIQLVFLGSLAPIILFIIVDIFLIKKITCKNFNLKKFFYDLVKCFLIFYFLLILFWIDTHPNIFLLPFNIILETFSENFWTGWPYNLINGNYFLSSNVPKYYLLINLFFKSPEFFLLCYLIFLIIFFSSAVFFRDKINLFNYKISLLFIILIFPNLILFLVPYPAYDGMRLFLWTLPYYCIIPGLTIYYLIENFKSLKSKITLLLLSFFIIYFLFNFFSITPYQYTYLNSLNGKAEYRYQKFENDYWGTSIDDLIENADLKKNENLKFSLCGINQKILESSLFKYGYNNFSILDVENAEYIVMTNRVVRKYEKSNNFELINCLDKYSGNDLFNVKRNGIVLSVIRKKN
jgi:hypothetical protein